MDYNQNKNHRFMVDLKSLFDLKETGGMDLLYLKALKIDFQFILMKIFD